MKPTEERQRELKNKYNFVCNCVACASTEEQIQCENASIERYKDEAENQKLYRGLRALTYELGCLEQMYKIASEEIKTSALRVVLYEIVERAYHVSLGESKEEKSTAPRAAKIGRKMHRGLQTLDLKFPQL